MRRGGLQERAYGHAYFHCTVGASERWVDEAAVIRDQVIGDKGRRVLHLLSGQGTIFCCRGRYLAELDCDSKDSRNRDRMGGHAMSYSRALWIAYAALGCVVAPDVRADDIDFMKAFQDSAGSGSINIDIDSSDVLVFPKQTVPLVLHGRQLVISAARVRLNGDFSIQQFDEQDIPAAITDLGTAGITGDPGRRDTGRNGAHGGPGHPGATGPGGTKGKNALTIVLDIEAIVGEGKLLIQNVGGTGGKAGGGGIGGTGGQGEGGANGSDGAIDCKAGGAPGGPGGVGGRGGMGGTGGTGGDGGRVRLSESAVALRSAGLIVIDIAGGIGGKGGEKGKKGPGGGGGPGGSGSTYCGGGRGGNGGGEGELGEEGLFGPKGNDGNIDGLKPSIS